MNGDARNFVQKEKRKKGDVKPKCHYS